MHLLLRWVSCPRPPSNSFLTRLCDQRRASLASVLHWSLVLSPSYPFSLFSRSSYLPVVAPRGWLAPSLSTLPRPYCRAWTVVSAEWITMNDDKVGAIQEWPTPTNLKSLQRLLDLANFCRQFIHEFSKRQPSVLTVVEESAYYGHPPTHII
ncbi:hypothetical protein LIPSTDRAFT_314152 [Lipomyces starkeyi NRRL Y-11557]|uniref:Uncharacterized protein n=1 Tax=Lipomyces starkeyi NRRL Y-11557 TaxID=675824 RepID=A0A1E3Q4B9_LIPST|nr:hypothetical protein LIPSTDRAFT_314152 [Lipomyces starkeyi NRRL Y-11557]